MHRNVLHRIACVCAIASTIVCWSHVPASAADHVAGSLVIYNDNAGWSWFQDERAIVDAANGKILVSSVANAAGPGEASRHGDVDIAALDIETGSVSRFVLRGNLQGDDHNSAALWQRPDGRYVAMYGTHFPGNNSLWRITDEPGDISAWSSEGAFNNGVAMTYSNLHYLPNDNGGAGRLYNFVRSNNFDPNILVSNDQGVTWSYGGKLLTEGGGSDRPYLRYFSDGERIHFIATERHPRNFDNSVFHGYVQNGQLFNSSGAVVDPNLFNSNAPAPSALTTVFATGTVVDGATMQRAWTVDVAIDGDSRPVAVFQARANNDDDDHRFFYGRWDGGQWIVNPLGYAGSFLYQAENDYTGLVSIDPDDVNTVYLSSEVHPATQAQLIGADGLRHYEIFRGTTGDGGATWQWTPITYNSTMDNIRPLVPKWDEENTAVIWMRGAYSTYTNYNMAAVGLVNPEVTEPSLALAIDFGATGQQVHSGFQPFTNSTEPVGEQTLHFDSSFTWDGEQVAVSLGGGELQFTNRGTVSSPVGAVTEDFATVAGDLTLTLGNLARGQYQLVLYGHDRDANQLTADIRLNGVAIGVLNPTSGVNPAIGVSSSRVGFSVQGGDDIALTLEGAGVGNVILNGFELYFVDGTPLPLVDLNGDGNLGLADLEMFAAGLHTDVSGLTAAEAYARGDVNSDGQVDFFDFVIIRRAYDLWNGQDAFAAALAEAHLVPEPRAAGLLLVGAVLVWWAAPISPLRMPVVGTIEQDAFQEIAVQRQIHDDARSDNTGDRI